MTRPNQALLGALLLTASSASALGGGTPVMTSVSSPWAMDYDPLRGGVWVTNGLLGEVTRIDQTGAVLQLVDLSTIPAYRPRLRPRMESASWRTATCS